LWKRSQSWRASAESHDGLEGERSTRPPPLRAALPTVCIVGVPQAGQEHPWSTGSPRARGGDRREPGGPPVPVVGLECEWNGLTFRADRQKPAALDLRRLRRLARSLQSPGAGRDSLEATCSAVSWWTPAGSARHAELVRAPLAPAPIARDRRPRTISTRVEGRISHGGAETALFLGEPMPVFGQSPRARHRDLSIGSRRAPGGGPRRGPAGEEEPSTAIAILDCPVRGKSSLLIALLGSERCRPRISRTTRDQPRSTKSRRRGGRQSSDPGRQRRLRRRGEGRGRWLLPQLRTIAPRARYAAIVVCDNSTDGCHSRVPRVAQVSMRRAAPTVLALNQWTVHCLSPADSQASRPRPPSCAIASYASSAVLNLLDGTPVVVGPVIDSVRPSPPRERAAEAGSQPASSTSSSRRRLDRPQQQPIESASPLLYYGARVERRPPRSRSRSTTRNLIQRELAFHL